MTRSSSPSHRRPAAAPGRLPPRDEAGSDLGDGSRAKGIKLSSPAASAVPRCLAAKVLGRPRPSDTLRADIDYGFVEARTTFGRIGVKCWIYKGEVMPEGYTGADLTDMTAPAPPEQRPRRSRRPRRARRPWPWRWRRRRLAAADAAAVRAAAGVAAGGAVAAAGWRSAVAGPGGGGRGPGGRWRRTRSGWSGRRAADRGGGGRQSRGDALMLSPKRVKHRKQHRGRRRGHLARPGEGPVRRVRAEGARAAAGSPTARSRPPVSR